MKYIVLQTENGDIQKELPIIFPDELVHSEVYKALVRSSDPNSDLIITGCVSAGSINSFDINPRCHGESTSLKIKSREETDDELIKMMDYFHGIVE